MSFEKELLIIIFFGIIIGVIDFLISKYFVSNKYKKAIRKSDNKNRIKLFYGLFNYFRWFLVIIFMFLGNFIITRSDKFGFSRINYGEIQNVVTPTSFLFKGVIGLLALVCFYYIYFEKKGKNFLEKYVKEDADNKEEYIFIFSIFKSLGLTVIITIFILLMILV